MPTYDYRCNACEHEFELFQSMSAGVKKKCPECGKMALERLIGIGAAVMFKGSGFYETDYRSESYKKSADADKKAAEAKTESKPEAKSEKKSDSKSDSGSGKKTDKKTESKPTAKKANTGSKA
ncbi:MAG: zinc ribbon domain-containing protein [Phycisphaerales bacterium]|nr:zinc ribbon domain-containing protein [Phycisphaerales bacterium]